MIEVVVALAREMREIMEVMMRVVMRKMMEVIIGVMVVGMAWDMTRKMMGVMETMAHVLHCHNIKLIHKGGK